MKKIIFGLAAVALVAMMVVTPVTTRAYTLADNATLQYLLTVLIDLQKQLIRLLAHQNPTAPIAPLIIVPTTTGTPMPQPTVAPDQTSVFITSMSPTSGPVGTIITLKGQNLAGFEGDLDAWIQNSAGEVAYLPEYGKSVYPATNQITVQITGQICKQNNSYSGNPCTAYMTITPGTYQIYTMPWGKKSNVLTFTVL